MGPLLLSLIALAQGTDVLRTRDGREWSGRIREYDRFVELEQPDGSLQRVPRPGILSFHPAPALRSPEPVPFPSELLERGDHDFLAAPGVLFAAARPPGRRLTAIDLASGGRIWDSDRPLRTGAPLLHHRTLYLLERAPSTGAPPASTPRLTHHAVDPATGETRRSLVLESADRKEFASNILLQPAPSLHVLADRLAVRTFRQAPDGGARWTALSFVDPKGLTLAGHLENPALPALGGRPTFLADRVITQLFSGTQWRLAALGLRDGSLLWQTPWMSGRLHDVHDDAAWFAAPGSGRLSAVDLQSGRIHDTFGVDLDGAVVADVDETRAVLMGGPKAPSQLRLVELRTGTVLWSLPPAPAEDLRFLLRIGHRIFLAAPAGALRCFDLNARKELWTWSGAGGGAVQHPAALGDGLLFFKDGRATLLDQESGLVRWELKTPWRGLQVLGSEAILAPRAAGMDLIRPRTLPPGGRFVGPGELPLCFSLGDETWCPPAFSGGLLYTVSARGRLVALEEETRRVRWELPLSTIPLPGPAAVTVHGARAVVTFGQEAQLIDLEGRKRLQAARHTPYVGGGHPPFGPSGFVLSTPAGLSCLDGSGTEVWASPLRPVFATAASRDAMAVLAASELHVLSLGSGTTRWTIPAPPGSTLIAFDGTTAVCAQGPSGWHGPDAVGQLHSRFQAKEKDSRKWGGFRGQLALADGRVYYAHADGELGCFEAASGKAIWSVPTPAFVHSLRLHEGRLWYSARDGGLHGIDRATGKTEWTRPRRDVEAWTPVLRGNRVVWWSSEGWLIEPE